MKIHAFRLRPGEDLKKEIEAFVQKQKIEAGWIITCVGSLIQTHLRYADKTFGTVASGHFEILALSGTISINGVHLHLCVGNEHGSAIGGHLLTENLVYTTAEVVIAESDKLIFTREKDGSTAWAELQITEKK